MNTGKSNKLSMNEVNKNDALLTRSIKSNDTLSGIAEVNALPNELFESVFENVIEDHSEAAREVASKRPFLNCENLKSAFDNYLEKLNIFEKEIILRKHPELAGELLDEGKLTVESQSEQKSVGLDSLTKEEKQTLVKNNLMYKEKFNFPFVICARENNFQTILSAIRTRLNNSREAEINVGIEEVKKICGIRISRIVRCDE